MTEKRNQLQLILFQEDTGCLTDQALQGLASASCTLTEMDRLEISEHLSFCDHCVERYAVLLTEDVLETPEESVIPEVMEHLQKRTRIVFFNRYVTCGIAACLAMVLWVSGVFTSGDTVVRAQRMSERTISTTEAFQEGVVAVSKRISEFFGNFSWKNRQEVQNAAEYISDVNHVSTEYEITTAI